ncbi:MAG TPA: methyl-accepting chemotaxis protein [Noviherbaspirillum sp.]|jgi:methyl-accepting chemotaxis protein|uniref:methyl-accepting chemotaxis protein n=1 Tax=Noviherbaspirillum sp. TaxID=1926288 RepID=UPI002F93ABAF
MKLRTRILFLGVAALIGMVLLAAFSLSALRSAMMKERLSQLSTLVVLAKASLEHIHAEEAAGKLSREDAQREAKRLIGSLKKDERYYFVRGYSDDVNHVHPNPKRVGIVDPKGGREAGERYRAALQGKEIGVVFAPGTRPGATEKVEKMYAVVKFEPWDWIIGFGDYIDDIDQAFWRNTAILLAIGGVLMIVMGALAWSMMRSIYRQLGGEPDYAARVVGSIADGDLTMPVEVRPGDTGSLLAAMRNMQQKLGQTIGEIRQSTASIAAASGEIAAGNQDLSARTEDQASSLQQTAASMEELTSTVRQNADNAVQASQLAATASDVATRGGSVIASVVDTMGSINDSSKKIVDIIGVIDSIAFQTNILALNAAVEAARAGEQGRGFAVVAAEVRSLAQRSASAAREIKGLIDDSVSKVDAGSALVDQAGHTMQEIVDSVRRVTEIIGEISSAGREQTAGIEQVNQAVTQMDQSTQQNAALVEQAAAAAAAMQEQARNLDQAIGAFRVAGAAPVRAVTAAPVRQQAARPQPRPAARRQVALPAARPGARKDDGDWTEF